MAINKKQFRSPGPDGRWEIGGAQIPSGILTALGRALAEWGFLEQHMDALLSEFIGAPALARVVRKEARTQKQRLAILKALIEATDVPEGPKYAELLSRFHALSNERGLFAHGIWGRHTGHPNDAILIMDDAMIEHSEIGWLEMMTSAWDPNVRMHQKMALVSVADLESFQQRSSKLVEDVLLAMLPLQRARAEKQLAQLSLQS